jgi:chemotaxis receptor (MCP) glutamine deamidase CheD
MGHIMLPGTGGPKSEGDLRYSERAIEKLVKGLATGGDGVGSRLLACAAGGANVLRDPQDTLCGELRRAVLEGLSRRGIPLVGVDLGGEIRRQVRLDSGSGKVFCAVGGEPETLLHEFLRED